MEAALPSPSTLGKDRFETGNGGTNLGARPLLIQSLSVLGWRLGKRWGEGGEGKGKVLRRRIENPTRSLSPGKPRNL